MLDHAFAPENAAATQQVPASPVTRTEMAAMLSDVIGQAPALEHSNLRHPGPRALLSLIQVARRRRLDALATAQPNASLTGNHCETLPILLAGLTKDHFSSLEGAR